MPPKKGFKHSEESRRINSEAKKGAKNPMFGKHHTEEWKQIMSDIQRGRTKSPETIQRMKDAHKNDPGPPKGRKHTEESKKKMSESKKGIIFSEEHLKHLSESHKGQIVTKEGRKKRSEYNKSHPEVTDRLRNTRCVHPSRPQKLLFEVVKALYPHEKVEMEYTLIISKNSRKFIDVAIPRLRLGFEFDGKYWHKNSKEKDLERHILIESLGWKLTHYSDASEFPKK